MFSLIWNRNAGHTAEATYAGLALCLAVVASLACTGGSSDNYTAASSNQVTFTAPYPQAVDVPVNTAIAVTFTDPVDSTTIDAANFVVSGAGAVTGTIAYDSASHTAIFRPASSLSINTTYTVSLSSTIKSAATGAGSITPFSYTFTTGALSDTTAPAGTAVFPTNNATNVPVNVAVTKTFTEALDPSTVTDSTLTIVGVTGKVRWIGTTAVFTPTNALTANTQYTGTLSTSARGMCADSITASETFTFTTGPIADNTRPTVETSLPAPGETRAVQAVTVVFSEEMNPATVTTKSFQISGVTGTVYCAGRTARFFPVSPLSASTTYTVSISTDAKDLAGNALLAEHSFTFQTAASADVASPAASLSVPASGETNIGINRGIHVTFSEPMDPLTITTATFRVSGETGFVSYDPTTRMATFRPRWNFRTSTVESVTISREVKDLSGNAMAAPLSFTFTTGTTTVATVPSLGAAGGFATLAGTTVTGAGTASWLNGDLGVSPGSAVTGFYGTSTNDGPGTVNGTVFQGVAVATSAQAALAAAIADITARTADTILTGTALAGVTLTPGVFIDTGNSSLASGNLTLDARGNADAFFIFQISGNLTTSGGARVDLVNGADPGRVFWQVGGSSTIGSGTLFHGTIMSQNSIDITSSILTRGRALAVSGSVTLTDSSKVSRP